LRGEWDGICGYGYGWDMDMRKRMRTSMSMRGMDGWMGMIFHFTKYLSLDKYRISAKSQTKKPPSNPKNPQTFFIPLPHPTTQKTH
jgi:hypothetical protein